MKYDKWQQEILNATGDILVNTGRQVGKTTTFAHKIAKHLLDNSKQQVIVVSLTEDQAQLIIIMILDFLEKNYKSLIQKGKNKPTKSRIWLKNNSRVISRPVGNTGDAVRGFTGDVLYIDEASGMPELMWKAAMPTLMTTGGQIWMSSTPRGKYISNGKDKNFFYKCWENEDNRWQTFTINSEEVMKSRDLTEEWTEEKRDKAITFLKNQKMIMAEMEYRQEYMAEFLDDNRQLLDDDLILKSMTEQQKPIKKGENLYLGVDIARMGDDESVFTIVKQVGDHIYHLDSQITKKTLLSDTTQRIIHLNRLYEFEKIFIDSVGMGIGVLDYLLKDDETKYITVGVDFSKQIISSDGRTVRLQKNVRYSNLKMLMETGKLHLLDDHKVFQSLKSMQFAYSNDNTGTRHLKIFGHYDHIADSLTYACMCQEYKHFNNMVYTIKV